MSAQNKTPVIFRRFRDAGDVIALFPTIPADVFGWRCLSYQTIGQRGSVNYETVARATRPASTNDKDVRLLIAELVLAGYNLDIVTRRGPWMRAQFQNALRVMRMTEWNSKDGET